MAKTTKPKTKNTKKSMRKRHTHVKPGNPKPGALVVYNTQRPKPQVFKKTAIYNVNGTNIITGAGAISYATGGALASSMPDWANIITLYNRYKMLKVTYTFNIQALPSAGASLFSFDLPKMMIRYNYDSNLAGGVTGNPILARMQEVPDVVINQFTPEKPTFAYTYYPRCIEPVYLSGVSTGYKLAKQQYIDIAYGSVPHYGIMWWIDTIPTGLTITYDISYEVAFKYQD